MGFPEARPRVASFPVAPLHRYIGIGIGVEIDIGMWLRMHVVPRFVCLFYRIERRFAVPAAAAAA